MAREFGAPDGTTTQEHATTVAIEGRAVLIRGASGSGKSALALQLMALGADLVADDRTDLRRDGDAVVATCPDPIRGRIEARGIGILAADALTRAPVVLVVDMDWTESARLPHRRTADLLGRSIRLFHKVESPHFAPAIRQYLKMHS